MAELVLSSKLVADSQGLRGEVRRSTGEFDKLTKSTDKTGRASRRAAGELDRYGRKAREAAARTLRLNSGVGSLRAGFAGLAAVAATFGLQRLIGGIVETNASFQSLTASMKTVTGSAEGARRALALIEDFTATTPFQLDEVVRAFIKLKALGLEPSAAALKSYGNTASAMSFSLNQFIEAIADAATGEFERLKEFGIKASVQGERVRFTFQKVTTEVGKNAAEIEGFLRGIGNVQFAGAMEEQMKILRGQFSNLSDNIARFQRQIGAGGLNAALSELVTKLIATTAGAKETALAIGRFLGGAVRSASAGLAALQENADLVLGTLAGIAASQAPRVLLAVAAAARTAAAGLAAMVAVIATPFGLIAAAIGLAVGALVAFRGETVTVRQQTASVADFVFAAWGLVTETIGTAFAAVQGFADGPWGARIVTVLKAIADGWRRLGNFAVGVVSSIADVAAIGGKGIADAFDNALDFVFGLFADLGKSVKALFSGEFQKAGEIAAAALGRSFESRLRDTGARIADAVAANFNRDWLGGFISDTWRGAESIFGPVIDDVAARAAKRYRDRLAAIGQGLPGAPPAVPAAAPSKPAAATADPARDKAHAEAVKDITARYQELLPVYDQAVAAANAWRDQALAGLDSTKAGYDDFAAQVEAIFTRQLADAQEEHLRSSRAWSDGAIRALKDYADAAGDAAAQVERTLTNAFGGAEDALVDFVKTGKLDFASLIDSMVTDLIRFQIQSQITGPLSEFLGGTLRGIFTPEFSGGTTFGDIPGTPVGTAHSGGIAGGALAKRAVDPRTFDGADRFHGGGLAGGEVPIIARRGEGIFTPEQMAALAPAGGGVKVEIVDQRGQGAPAPQVSRSRGPDGLEVIRVFIADEVNKQVRQGGFDGALEDSFGIRRSGTQR